MVKPCVMCRNAAQHTHKQTTLGMKYVWLDGGCRGSERGLSGVRAGLVRHINQTQRCVCVPVHNMAPGLGWAWPGERGGGSE